MCWSRYHTVNHAMATGKYTTNFLTMQSLGLEPVFYPPEEEKGQYVEAPFKTVKDNYLI